MERVEGVMRGATAIAGRTLRPLVRRLRRVPIEIRIGALALSLFVIAFAAAVVPLLTTGGRNPTAEVAVRIPSQMRVADTVILPLAIDNTSGSIIQPLCLIARSEPPGTVTPTQAEFQGLETIRFVDGRACGGELSGQETISVRLTLAPRRAGFAQLTLAAAQGATEIGPEVHGTVEVTP